MSGGYTSSSICLRGMRDVMHDKSLVDVRTHSSSVLVQCLLCSELHQILCQRHGVRHQAEYIICSFFFESLHLIINTCISETSSRVGELWLSEPIPCLEIMLKVIKL
jgi:hypothetical protein